MIEVYKLLTGKYDPTYPVFYIATVIAPPGVTHWNCAHIVLCKYNFTVRVITH